MFKNSKSKVNLIVMIAALTALEIILSRFFSIAAWNTKIGFAFIPLVVAAVLYGPLGGAIVGGLSDLIGAVLFPSGTFFPGFTLTAILLGTVFGLFLHKKRSIIRIAGAVLTNQIIGSLILNTLWISILYGTPMIALIPTRIFQTGLMIVVQITVIIVLDKMLLTRLKKITGNN